MLGTIFLLPFFKLRFEKDSQAKGDFWGRAPRGKTHPKVTALIQYIAGFFGFVLLRMLGMLGLSSFGLGFLPSPNMCRKKTGLDLRSKQSEASSARRRNRKKQQKRKNAKSNRNERQPNKNLHLARLKLETKIEALCAKRKEKNLKFIELGCLMYHKIDS